MLDIPKKKLVIGFTGPFGVGKTTLMKELMAQTSIHIGQIIRHTSRQKADHEREGIHYFFRTDEEIADMNNQEKFYECIKNTAGYYATSKTAIHENLPKYEALAVDIGLDASKILKKNLAKVEIPYMDFFVIPGANSLLETEKGQLELMKLLDSRSSNRKKRSFETESELEARKQVTLRWFQQAKLADLVLANYEGKLTQTVDSVLSIISSKIQALHL